MDTTSSSISRKGLSTTCSLITPLKNERENIAQLWEAIQGQTYRPAEWIIADNGSTDGTYEWLSKNKERSSFPVTVLELPGCTLAAMMNTAIRLATSEILVCCHGGMQIPQMWLESLLKPMQDELIDVAGGAWRSYGETPLEQWVAKNMWTDNGNLDEQTWLPASRSLAFRRAAWVKVGGFPEWLPRFGEDTLFAIRLHVAGCRFALVRHPVVGWRPKSSLGKLFRQYKLYSEADALMGLRTYPLKFFARPWCFFALAAFVVLAVQSFWIGLMFFLVMVVTDYVVLLQRKVYPQIAGYFFWAWFIHIAEQVGYVQAAVERLTGRVRLLRNDLDIVRAYRRRLEGHKGKDRGSLS